MRAHYFHCFKCICIPNVGIVLDMGLKGLLLCTRQQISQGKRQCHQTWMVKPRMLMIIQIMSVSFAVQSSCWYFCYKARVDISVIELVFVLFKFLSASLSLQEPLITLNTLWNELFRRSPSTETLLLVMRNAIRRLESSEMQEEIDTDCCHDQRIM